VEGSTPSLLSRDSDVIGMWWITQIAHSFYPSGTMIVMVMISFMEAVRQPQGTMAKRVLCWPF
jgi:hypothetical protein